MSIVQTRLQRTRADDNVFSSASVKRKETRYPMTSLRDTYATKALSQIPRLLGNLDRNRFSPTYGCFHRDYWLDKTSDFPDAVRQFGMHALALVYRYDFPDNIYKGHKKILEWTIAALNYWAGIQHKDGSFDEFYPYERGWVGPSAFTAYTAIETYSLLKDEIDPAIAGRVLIAIQKSASFIGRGEAEEDHLANHHAMACLALWKAYRLLDDQQIKVDYENAWKTFLTYHNVDEGWSREYDGVDPGYLSATISFLGKIYQNDPNPELLQVLKQSVDFSLWFVYPNGFYGGSMGSRNTLHFYPHGYEIMAGEIPAAGAAAEKMLKGLADEALVPPEIISDRYVFYRVPEFLMAWLDYGERSDEKFELPYQCPRTNRFFPQSKIFAAVNGRNYLIANLAKGGVVKCFDKEKEKLLVNDCGVIGQLEDGAVITSQWISDSYRYETCDNGFSVSGEMNVVPSNKLFTPEKNVLFRSGLVVLGRVPTFSHMLKGQIRKHLILQQRKVPIRFRRTVTFLDDELIIEDELEKTGDVQVKSLWFGDEFFVRYVPQSRYFQRQELDVEGQLLTEEEMRAFNDTRKHRRIDRMRLK